MYEELRHYIIGNVMDDIFYSIGQYDWKYAQKTDKTISDFCVNFKEEDIKIYSIDEWKENRKYYKKKSGVYFFITCDDKLMYMGKSINFYNRLNLNTHHVARKHKSIIDKIAIIEIGIDDQIRYLSKYDMSVELTRSKTISVIERAGIKVLMKYGDPWNIYKY